MAPRAGHGRRGQPQRRAAGPLIAWRRGAAGTAAFLKSLFVQVLIALLLGIALGVVAPDFAIELKILSDAFLKLISMIVAPIVFCVVVHGIAGAGDLKKVGRVGVKALINFEATAWPPSSLRPGKAISIAIPRFGCSTAPRWSTSPPGSAAKDASPARQARLPLALLSVVDGSSPKARR